MPLPCIDGAGSVQGLTVHSVLLLLHGPCRDHAWTVHRLSGAKRPTCIIIYAVIEDGERRGIKCEPFYVAVVVQIKTVN